MQFELISMVCLLALVLSVAYYIWTKIADCKLLPGIPVVTVWSSAGFNVLPEHCLNGPESEQIMGWLERKCIELDTPILQIRSGLPGKPYLVIADSSETQRILTHRLHEFDRTRFLAASFLALLPYNHMTMPTNDEWRTNRRLIAGTMAPPFLNGPAASHIHKSTLEYIDLLVEKANKSAGKPFDVAADTFAVMLDGIAEATLGKDIGAVRQQLEHIRTLELPAQGVENRSFASFPRRQDPSLLDALVLLMSSLHIPTHAMGGPLLHSLAMTFVPRYRHALKLVRSQLDDSIRIAESKRKDLIDKCEVKSLTAAGIIVDREMEQAKAQERAPILYDGLIRDELFGILFGFDVLAIMAIWSLKILTAHQDVQQKLRSELRANFPAAATAGTVPSAAEIATTPTPYLDAVYEEILRCVGSTPALVRTTTRDVTLLSHRVPKGTTVFLLVSTHTPLGEIIEVKVLSKTRGRTYTHRSTKVPNGEGASVNEAPPDVWTGNWSSADLSSFKPERWLCFDSDGHKRFNARAGPRHMLGTGVRACFGQKQATSVMRIFLALVVWRLELRSVSADLARFDRAGAAFVYRAKEAYLSPQVVA